jgi:predicted nuclease of predicted toxin-antitoxin system
VRFLVDMPLSPALAAWLAEQGHDAVHALNLAMDRSPDAAIIQRARREQRVVITADLDYPRLLALERADGPGLILFRGGNYSEREALHRLQAALASVPEEELPQSIVVIEKQRIRRRRLPVL